MTRKELQIYRQGAKAMAEKCRDLALKLAGDADDRLDHGLSRSVLTLCANKIEKLRLPK